jgi:hypothetical protein
MPCLGSVIRALAGSESSLPDQRAVGLLCWLSLFYVDGFDPSAKQLQFVER